MQVRSTVFTGLLLASLLAVGGRAATIDVYISPPGGQSSPVAGSITEDFNAVPLGTKASPFLSPIGQYMFSPTEVAVVQNADQYGGANGTRYLAFGAQSGDAGPVRLVLPSPQRYFGFWWSAGDNLNGISFYRNGHLLARFETVDVRNILGGSPPTVTAVDSSVYNKADYYGNPNAPSGRNTSEPYAYILFFGNGVVFDAITLDNNGSTGTGFESDNHSIKSGPVTVPGPSVLVKEVVADLVGVPEPGSFLPLAAGLLGLAAAKRRKK